MRATQREAWQRNGLSQTLRKRYGLTLEAEQLMLEKQDGRCALCRNPLSDDRRRRHIDHVHGTKVVRGIVCSACNTRRIPVLEELASGRLSYTAGLEYVR